MGYAVREIGNIMAKTVLLQLLAMALLAAGAYFVAGYAAAVSAVLGGVVYIIPTVAAVLIVKLLGSFPVIAGMTFIFAQSFKIALALVLLLVLFYFYHQQIVFIPFILSMTAVSHLVFLVSWKVQKNGK